MNLNWIILSLLLPLSLTCFSQEKKVDSLFMAFKKDVQILQKYNDGKIIWDDETRETYDCLLNICPINKLVKYTNDPNAFIRGQMFSGLAQKKVEDKILNDIVNNHLSDSAEFTFGKQDWTVIGYMQWILDLKSNNLLPNISKCEKTDRKINAFQIIFEGISHNVISKEVLIKLDSLILTSKDWKIVSFVMFTSKTEVHSTSDKLTGKMKRIIENLNSGNKVFFEQIKAKGPDGNIRTLGSKTLILE